MAEHIPKPVTIRVQSDPFDQAAEYSALAEAASGAGAIISFTGICRDEGGTLAALELEHFPGMAEEQLTRIAETATQRWQVLGVTIVHRHGKITPGEDIVLVLTASSHRADAFAAAEFIMDFLKTEAPFWKKEHLVSTDDEAADAKWVDAKSSDDDRAARW